VSDCQFSSVQFSYVALLHAPSMYSLTLTTAFVCMHHRLVCRLERCLLSSVHSHTPDLSTNLERSER